MGPPSYEKLVDAIAEAARKAFSALFTSHPGHYYYVSLVSTGEALPPVVAAWSKEALQAEGSDEEERRSMKWSWADSPYLDFGATYFGQVKEMFANRPNIDDLNGAEWDTEYELRYSAMEAALARLDSDGLFGTGAERLKTVVLVETVPPDSTNTERAMRLNPKSALEQWLAEAAEPP